MVTRSAGWTRLVHCPRSTMSTTTDVKTKAKKWVNSLFRHHAATSNQAAGGGKAGSSSQHVELNLAPAFSAMSLSKNTRHDTYFVGGFNPALSSNTQPMTPVYPKPGPLPVPPKMSLPVTKSPGEYSKTMQYALYDQTRVEIPEQLAPSSLTAPQPSPANSTRPSPVDDSNKATSTPRKARTSTGSQKQVQCAGFTKAGKRCTRQVKINASLEVASSESEDDMVVRYCFQHVKEINSATGFYARKNGVWIAYNNWIPDHLLPETQASLRAEMEKARSSNDTPGYIYTFEIREPDSTTIKFKIGRATNHVRRLDQWGKQCGSKEQVRLGIYPEPDAVTSNLRGLQELDDTRKAAWCHRLERLIHLELADLVSAKAYLDPAWPTPKTLSKSKTNNTGDTCGDKRPCADCGSVHKEIFEFEKIKNGRYKGKEYERIVKPIIEKWGGFVDDFV
ncbi:hypothetical protein JOM56_003637 [Amanita muscaria]